MTIWPNSLKLGQELKNVAEISNFVGFPPPFGALYIITRFGGRRHGRRLTNTLGGSGAWPAGLFDRMLLLMHLKRGV